MKSRNLLFSFAALALIGFAVILSVRGNKEQRKYHPRKATIENGIHGALEWLASIRNNKITGTISIEEVLNARKQIAELNNSKALGITWSELGPNNVGGRVRAILIDKDNPSLMYAGAVSGGLWKSASGGSSWIPVSSFPDINIACIAQNPITGALYVGTGESFANVDSPYGTPGFLGTGLYESTDGGNTWAIYNGATPAAPNNTNDTWAFVNKIDFDKTTGRLYVATKKGMLFWSGTEWVNPIYVTGTTPNTGNSTTVVVGSDGTVAAVVGNKLYVSPNGNEGTFVDRSATTGNGRVEVAIAPSDPNVMYYNAVYPVSNANRGKLKGVYRSTDKGQNWTLIGPGLAPSFDLFGDNGQGDYDNVMAVSPVDPNLLFAGGINIWRYYTGGNFTQVTAGYEVHVDIHALVFSKTDPNTFYVGCDGGLYKTHDLGVTWQAINKNFNVTQFYTVAQSKTGEVMGGTQDNSVPYLPRTGVDPKYAEVLFGGDGGWSAFSAISPSVFFGTMQYGGTWRTPDKGVTYQSATEEKFFSPTMIGTATPGSSSSFGQFVTPLLHWESFADYYSFDSVTFVADKDYNAGETVVVKSNNNNYPFQYILPFAVDSLEEIRVQDIISSKFFVALTSGIWMTKQALDFSITPAWVKISNVNCNTMAISNCGNYLFLGTASGALYRISNILAVKDSVNGTIGGTECVIEQKLIESFSGRSITGIAIDPNDPSRLVVVLGDYGNTTYVYYSSNALNTDPTFTAKQGTTAGNKLPAMPVYSAMIEMSNPNVVLVGTEYGIYATENITASAAAIVWTEENTGMNRVPVFGIRQQSQLVPDMTNYGMVYIGTHGRGFFETNMFMSSVPEVDATPVLAKPGLRIFPNPVIDQAGINITLPVASKVVVNIYDLFGRVVKTIDLGQMSVGSQSEYFDLSDLSRGTYVMQLIAGKESTSQKFVLTR